MHCALILLAVGTALAQQNKLKVYISADMEGIGGVSTWTVQASSGGQEYQKFRRLMTKEVNAAVQGAFAAGATEVLVSDSHANAQNIDVELLDKRVRLIRAWPRPLGMVGGIDDTFDALVFVGYHAGAGQGAATLSHTISGKFFDIKLNGNSMPEAGINGAIAAEFNVPVVFLSGDQTICAEAERLFGPIETVAVKQASGYYSARMMHPEESQSLVSAGVRRGIERRASIRAKKLARPVRLEITFTRPVLAEIASYLPGVERPRGNTVTFTARDMIEGSKFLNAVHYMNFQ
jgi:D-amino peptidase